MPICDRNAEGQCQAEIWDKDFGCRETERQQTEAEGERWRWMESKKEKKSRDREIIADPEREKGMDGYTEKKRQRQP